jgi:hypothetical protein
VHYFILASKPTCELQSAETPTHLHRHPSEERVLIENLWHLSELHGHQAFRPSRPRQWTPIQPLPRFGQVSSKDSSIMTLLPGDLIFTGAPPGVGPIHSGDLLDVRISRLGSMRIRVR